LGTNLLSIAVVTNLGWNVTIATPGWHSNQKAVWSWLQKKLGRRFTCWTSIGKKTTRPKPTRPNQLGQAFFLSFLGRVGNWAWPNRLKILK
jgi:hypothetical protein